MAEMWSPIWKGEVVGLGGWGGGFVGGGGWHFEVANGRVVVVVGMWCFGGVFFFRGWLVGWLVASQELKVEGFGDVKCQCIFRGIRCCFILFLVFEIFWD